MLPVIAEHYVIVRICCETFASSHFISVAVTWTKLELGVRVISSHNNLVLLAGSA